MKSKDDTLLQEAYSKILVKENETNMISRSGRIMMDWTTIKMKLADLLNDNISEENLDDAWNAVNALEQIIRSDAETKKQADRQEF